MSISSSIYIGTTGILAHQESMSVISDNIANVNTTGFKSSRMLFNTLMSQQLEASDVSNQVGQGVGVSSIYRDMTVGSLISTNTPTDIAINGIGFFMVSPQGTDEVYYTRDGSFRFDKDAYLRDTHGNIVQGYQIPRTDGQVQPTPDAGSVALQDIRLTTSDGGSIVSEPESTTNMRMMINLDSDSTDRSTSTTSPFTALFDRWDATQEEPLAPEAYSYQSSLSVYDSAGERHTVTGFFDPVTDITDGTNGYRTWEFLMTVPPGEDASALETKKGVLMSGTMTFSPAGELVSISAFSGTSDDKTSWVPVGLSEDGFPLLTGTFEGADPFSSVLDMGISSTSGWSLPTGVATMADLDTNFASLPTMSGPTKGAMAFTNYSTGSNTVFQSQNGYAEGYLQSVSVDSTGTIIGKFSNGQKQALYQIPLADFINPQGLFREGGNLFTATNASGPVSVGWATSGRLGGITANALENSNVDLATEFVNMIVTQKGFDANSKVITTGDQVVQTAIQMKR